MKTEQEIRERIAELDEAARAAKRRYNIVSASLQANILRWVLNEGEEDDDE